MNILTICCGCLAKHAPIYIKFWFVHEVIPITWKPVLALIAVPLILNLAVLRCETLHTMYNNLGLYYSYKIRKDEMERKCYI
jgi:hypothetical protein